MAHDLTTLANIPLAVWLIYAMFSLRHAGYEEFALWMSHPVNMVMAVLFIISTLKHFTLELEVVFEDYISNISLRNLIIVCMKIFWFVLGVATIISVLKLGL